MCMSPRVIQLFADIEQFVRMRADCLYHEATAIVWCYMNLYHFCRIHQYYIYDVCETCGSWCYLL